MDYQAFGYEFEVEYKQGKENKVADALSRKLEFKKEGALSALTLPSTSWLNQLRTSYTQDPKLQDVLQKLEQGVLDQQRYTMKDGLLFYKGKFYIGAFTDMRNQILQLLHSSPQGGHSGYHKMLHRAKR